MADDTYTDEIMDSWLGDGLPTDFVGTIANAKFAIPVDSRSTSKVGTSTAGSGGTTPRATGA